MKELYVNGLGAMAFDFRVAVVFLILLVACSSFGFIAMAILLVIKIRTRPASAGWRYRVVLAVSRVGRGYGAHPLPCISPRQSGSRPRADSGPGQGGLRRQPRRQVRCEIARDMRYGASLHRQPATGKRSPVRKIH